MRRHFGLLVGLSAAGYVLSFCSQLLISYYFGTSVELDAYWTGLALVNLMCFYLHPLREALVPAVHRAALMGDESAGRVLSAGITLLALLAGSSSVLLWAFSAGINNLITGPEVSTSSEDHLLRLVPWLIPYLWMLVLSESLSAVLISFDRAILQATGRLVASVFLIVVLAAFGAWLGLPALLLGQILSMLVVSLIFIVALRRLKIRLVYRFYAILHTSNLFPLFFSLLGAQIFSQIYVVSERSAMLYLSSGLVSSFQYSTSLMNVLVSLLAVPLSSLLWPRFLASDHSDRAATGILAAKSVGALCMILAVACTFIWLNASDVIYLLFGRGAFDSNSVAQTAEAVRATIFAAIPIGFGSVIGRLIISTRSSVYQILIGLSTTIGGMVVISVSVVLQSTHVILWHLLVANTVGAAIAAWVYIRYAGFSMLQLGRAASWTLRLCIILALAAVATPALQFGMSKWHVLTAMAVEGGIFCCITAVAGWICGLVRPFEDLIFKKSTTPSGS